MVPELELEDKAMFPSSSPPHPNLSEKEANRLTQSSMYDYAVFPGLSINAS